MDELARRWLTRAKYDLETAEAMFRAKRYLYVAFTCQQSLEKVLKAIVAEKGKRVIRTHNLPRLAEKAEVLSEMEEGDMDFLADLTPFVIETRYGDYRESLSEIVDRKKAARYLRRTREVFEWLSGKLG